VLNYSGGGIETTFTQHAVGGLIGFGIGARLLGRGADPYRLAGTGTLAGLAAFSALIIAAPLEAPFLFALGVAGVGLGAGLTLAAAAAFARVCALSVKRDDAPAQVRMAPVW
jgi:MFS transporter, BCD family, chlorophyll transporter